MADENVETGTVETPSVVTPPTNTPPANNPPPNQTINMRELVDAINALPERINSSLQEAFKPPKTPEGQQNPPAEEKKEPEAKQEGKRRRTFAEMWFG